jgi:cellulose synthase (UDP-forming)
VPTTRYTASDRSTAAHASTFNADDTLVYLDPRGRRLAVQATSMAALLVYTGYLIYRVLYTINYDAIIFSSLLYLAELHGFLSLFFYFHSAWAMRGRRVVAPPSGLKVDVFITTYNEDLDLLRKTVRAAIAMRYPHRTFILDDGRRPAVRGMADELGCEYVTRSDNRHAKAGNWNNAFAMTDGEVIATFDADHVPQPEFLERTLGFFADPKVALVQVPQLYHNLDSVQHRVSWRQRRMYSEQDAFFNLVMPGKDNWNAAFFCGTGAVLRREALIPLGGIKIDTITEDLHTSVVLHSQGWKSVYLNELLVTGLAPADLKAFEIQRLRWAEGNMKVAFFINPLTASGLTLNQRIAYCASLYHWTVGVPKFIYYIAPPWILFTGTFPIANYDRTFLLIYATFLTTLTGSYVVASRGRGRLLLDELYNMVSFFTLTRAVKRVLFGRGNPTKFEVTNKKGSASQDFGPVKAHLALMAFSIFAMVWSALGLGFGVSEDHFGLGTAMFWTTYNLAMMLIIVGIATRPPEKRAAQRFRANFPVEILDVDGAEEALGVTVDLSEGGCSLLWPVPLTPGARVRLRIHLASKTAVVAATIGTAQDGTDAGWHRYGVEFDDLNQAALDLVNDSIYTIVVPHLFSTLSTPNPWVRVVRAVQRRIEGRDQARSRRHPVRLPVRIDVHGDRRVVSSVDLSATGISLLMPVPLAVGDRVQLAMSAPDRQWTGEGSVARVVPQLSHNGFNLWLVGLRFESEQDVAVLAPYQVSAAA